MWHLPPESDIFLFGQCYRNENMRLYTHHSLIVRWLSITVPMFLDEVTAGTVLSPTEIDDMWGVDQEYFEIITKNSVLVSFSLMLLLGMS